MVDTSYRKLKQMMKFIDLHIPYNTRNNKNRTNVFLNTRSPTGPHITTYPPPRPTQILTLPHRFGDKLLCAYFLVIDLSCCFALRAKRFNTNLLRSARISANSP